MAILLRTSMRPHLLYQNPSHLPALLLQLPPSCRSFHASPRPQYLDAAIGVAHSGLEAIHSTTGLPWAYTLPLAALAIRTTITLPISIYMRRGMQQQIELSPLLNAWRHVFRKKAMKEAMHTGPAAINRQVYKQMSAKRKELFRRWDCPRWRNFLGLVQLPFWLVMIETIRKMCGAHVGLLGMMAARISGGVEDAAATAAAAITSLPKEASLATEGALWFPDLLVPDPHLVLPFMLSGAILLNLSNALPSKNPAVWQKRLVRSLRIVALAIGPLTLQVPSAMLVYWISSSTLAYTQARLLDAFMPLKKLVEPCKPKMTTPPSQEL
ncbi:hypothetical protein BP5796_02784 [Coleophoma crateriformis]|uniref:Mitochondrial inner membrane protein COX18 n=1 Tax=Coleophoma crateriformis TaxID=565419 RepID=A0A3D8SZE6_9HELO|nr:hypothetical protein BP5796_02784 [Coleophoma crateriformis]